MRRSTILAFETSLLLTLMPLAAVPAAAQEILPFPPKTFRQHSRADHAGVNLQSAATGEPSTEGCA